MLKLVTAFRKLLRIIATRGPLAAARIVEHNLALLLIKYLDARFDRKYGVDTAGVVELGALAIDGEEKAHGVFYQPVSMPTLRSIFSNLPADVSDYTFVDYGSGKGRVLLVASDYPFKRIIGVEFSKELNDIALSNVQAYHSKAQKCRDIRPTLAEATSFPVPDGKCIFYFYHPFVGPVMSATLENIERSYRNDPRSMYLVYYQQLLLLAPVFDALECFERIPHNPLPLDLGNPYRKRLFEVHSAYRTGLAIYRIREQT